MLCTFIFIIAATEPLLPFSANSDMWVFVCSWTWLLISWVHHRTKTFAVRVSQRRLMSAARVTCRRRLRLFINCRPTATTLSCIWCVRCWRLIRYLQLLWHKLFLSLLLLCATMVAFIVFVEACSIFLFASDTSQWFRMVYLSGAGLPRLSWKKGH